MGQAVGRAIRLDSSFRAVFWDVDGLAVDLNNLLPADSPWTLTDASGINDSSQIVGPGLIGGLSHPYLFSMGGVTDLGVLPGTLFGAATGINASGTVVGFCFSGSGTQAFMWDNVSGMVNLGMLPGDTIGLATALNNAGQVVGVSGDMTGASRAVLWKGGVITDLNSFFTGSGWQLATAEGINDIGQIAGSGRNNGVPRAYLITPMSGVPNRGQSSAR
jgi:probable HAF family extracellular repeat protein